MQSRTCIFLMLAFVGADAYALSPPWITLQHKFYYSYGQGTCTSVGELEKLSEGRYRIRVDACEQPVANALATILKRSWKFTGVTVKVVVFGPNGVGIPLSIGDSRSALMRILNNALKGNRYFVAVRSDIRPFGGQKTLVIEVKNRVIQFWNDNLGDFYGNEHYVAHALFGQITKREFAGSSRFAGWTSSPE